MKTRRNTSLHRTFRIIQGVVGLLLIFLSVQGVILWKVCREGAVATRGLVSGGLPSLRCLASLQENLAIYRLRSYELMFAQEKDRPVKISQADALEQQNRQILEELKHFSGERRPRPGAGTGSFAHRIRPGHGAHARVGGKGFSRRHEDA